MMSAGSRFGSLLIPLLLAVACSRPAEPAQAPAAPAPTASASAAPPDIAAVEAACKGKPSRILATAAWSAYLDGSRK